MANFKLVWPAAKINLDDTTKYTTDATEFGKTQLLFIQNHTMANLNSILLAPA